MVITLCQRVGISLEPIIRIPFYCIHTYVLFEPARTNNSQDQLLQVYKHEDNLAVRVVSVWTKQPMNLINISFKVYTQISSEMWHHLKHTPVKGGPTVREATFDPRLSIQ